MANTTEDKLRAALASKESIREAIESKGVECGADVPLSAYPDAIRRIPVSGMPSLKINRVQITDLIFIPTTMQTEES